eukprot:CAMPEP_0185848200 /NCGR_PEP_ID=MMETSP1354-20130828/3174_1 /TAXON_ID=708628 /ORGANISM="Erythrolobus madagascarensis, Strain CCMP3276" /LENGTH=195 /DNA_ID=CAMNT_0028548571 /DNA_START=237 /DNA_END=824 /DNA_ORIENTATION=-
MIGKCGFVGVVGGARDERGWKVDRIRGVCCERVRTGVVTVKRARHGFGVRKESLGAGEGEDYCPEWAMQLAPGIKVGRPKTSISKDTKKLNEPAKTPEPEAVKGKSRAKPRGLTESEDIPLFKVILLGDEEYDEVHVITQLVKIVQLEKNEANRVFGVAQATGAEVIVVVNEEQAEFYVQQLRRQEVYATMEPDD